MIEPNYPLLIIQTLESMARARVGELTRQLGEVLNYEVHFGAFKGMLLPRLPAQTDRYGCDDASKMLGAYESELYPSIEQAIQRKPDIVINVGAAEGYYAVGLARRLPQCEVYAFETNAEGRELCKLAAAQNGVAERIHIRERCSDGDLLEFTKSGKNVLIIMDCEGQEMQLINADSAKYLEKCDIIIECHDFLNRTITPTILPFLMQKHDVNKIRTGGRDTTIYPFLEALRDIDRWLLVCEFRPEIMHWFACWARR